MVFFDGNSHLDYLYQKSLRYKHHRENYVTSLLEGFIPKGLRIKKRPAFEAVTDYFKNQSYTMQIRKLKLNFRKVKR